MSRFTALYEKGCLQLIQIFLWIWNFSDLLRKTNFPSISEIISERVNFLTKKMSFSELARKCFKTTENHSLAVCGSLWGENQFLLIFVPFYWFVQKQLFKQIQIFLRICPFSNKGGRHLKLPKLEQIFVTVITYFSFLLCKYFWYYPIAYCVCFMMICKKSR